ncbi:hypothetical protein [Streptomyces sp. NPDC002889]|uniref:hypothetical protein n=1 Tax=Streptomyces sp. NPDC002889 TaxID=3364669 RepID=UPI00368C247A
MSPAKDAARPVIVLDLRSGAHTLAAPGALRATVQEQLRREGLPEPEDYYRFLVVDTPHGLTAHHSLYEQILGYRTVGQHVRVLCLVVGDLPGSASDEAHGGAQPAPGGVPEEGNEAGYGRRMQRPAALRGPDAGLLWAGDLRAARTAGDPVSADDPDALAILVDLLRALFDDTLETLAQFPDAVAVPGVRVLEHDLSEAARTRAWRQALSRFAGDRAEAGAHAARERGEGISVELPKPMDELAAGRPAGRVPGPRVPGGPADRAHLNCANALNDAWEAVDRFRGPGGLVTGAGGRAAAQALDDAAHGLAGYRQLVLKALQDGGPAAGAGTAESTLRLAELGIQVPPHAGGREGTGEGLRRLAERMLGERLALRSVAERFAALSEQVAPVPGAALLPEVDRRCPTELLERVSAAQRFTVAAASPGQLAGALVATALAALWTWPVTLAALAVLLVLVGGSLLAGARRPNREAGAAMAGSASTGALPQAAAALLGAGVGAWSATLWKVPPWAGLTGLLLGLGLAVVLVLLRWSQAVDRWWERTGAADAQRALDGLDALLAEAVLRQWWAADERMYCANAARMVAGALRGAAASAEALDGAVARGSGPGQSGDGGWGEPPAQEPVSRAVGEAPAGTELPDWMPAPDAYERIPGSSEGAPGPGDGPPETAPAGVRATADRPSGEGPAWLDREAGEGGPDLVETLVGDLVDAVVTALEPYWGAVERGRAGGAALTRIEQGVREQLGAAHRHLLRNGVVSAPPFARFQQRRGTSEGLLGIGAQRVAEATDPNPDLYKVVQLVSPEQAPLLSRDPSAVEWIRFAPEAVWNGAEARHALDPESPPAAADASAGTPPVVRSRAVWTSSGRYAGLLRLVPLRAGVVESVRLREWADGEDGAYEDADWHGQGGDDWTKPRELPDHEENPW